MRLKTLGRRGQNTVEYLMMVAVVVGVVLVGGSMLKKFMPSLFNNVQDMIAGTASGDEGSTGDSSGGGGMGSSKSGGSASKSGGSLGPIDDSGPGSIASSGADGGTRGQNEPGHGHAKGPPRTH